MRPSTMFRILWVIEKFDHLDKFIFLSTSQKVEFSSNETHQARFKSIYHNESTDRILVQTLGINYDHRSASIELHNH
jgi:hypothetical protein